MPPGVENISDSVMEKFFSKLQVHLNHSAEVIVGAQSSIYLLNSKVEDVLEDHTTIWFAMGDIMKKLISHVAVLDNLDIGALMKESRDAHLLIVNIKSSVDDAIPQATSETSKVGSVSATITQLVTTGAGGRLDATHHALNIGDQNIGVLQQTLNKLCNVVGNLDQNMYHLSQNGSSQLIKSS